MTSRDEIERIKQSNDIAGIVIDVADVILPERFATLNFRYGIADALWEAGYRKVDREPSVAEVEAAAEVIYGDDSPWGDLTEAQRIGRTNTAHLALFAARQARRG